MKTVSIAIKIFLIFTILTGIIYPLLVTGLAQVIFPYQANGSLMIENNKRVGSELIGQQFESSIYFSSRPSAIGNNPLPSGGSNLGLTSGKLKAQIVERNKSFITFNKLDINTEVPAEMLFASASGLDPHISARAAQLQINRIASERGFNAELKQKLTALVSEKTERPQWGCLGQERVNVLVLNIALDKIK